VRAIIKESKLKRSRGEKSLIHLWVGGGETGKEPFFFDQTEKDLAQGVHR